MHLIHVYIKCIKFIYTNVYIKCMCAYVCVCFVDNVRKQFAVLNIRWKLSSLSFRKQKRTQHTEVKYERDISFYSLSKLDYLPPEIKQWYKQCGSLAISELKC